MQSSSLICQSPTKAIWWYIMKTVYTYAACLCIELCQIVMTLERILFMISWSRFTGTPHTPLLCFFEKLALYHPLIPKKQMLHYMCWSLSLSLNPFESMAISLSLSLVFHGPSCAHIFFFFFQYLDLHVSIFFLDSPCLSSFFLFFYAWTFMCPFLFLGMLGPSCVHIFFYSPCLFFNKRWRERPQSHNVEFLFCGM